MITSSTKILLLSRCSFYMRFTSQFVNKNLPVGNRKHAIDQMDYIKTILENRIQDWPSIKDNILKIQGSLNNKNIDGVLLKVMVNNKKFDEALSYAEYLKRSDKLNLGSINGVLALYFNMGQEKELSEEDKLFILDTHKSLYEKYKVLDSTTCERLLHALCAIKEWKKALNVLEDIHHSCTPTHSAYSTLIATLFKINKKSEAMKLIDKSIDNRRPLKHVAYEEWINYILRKYKDKKTIAKYLEEIFLHISRNYAIITMDTAMKIKDTYNYLGWRAHFTKIRKLDGQCQHCNNTLQHFKLTEEEFKLLQRNIKDKLIVGSDLLLKSSPQELTRFMEFVENTAPYDIVLDGLNISFAAGKHSTDRISILATVVQHFIKQNKKILLLGRKHMIKWPNMKRIMNITSNFFTDNLSQDDPYFITAAILSGSHTDIVSKDMLRGHKFQLKDKQLRVLFQKWQWQHQWKIFLRKNGQVVIQAPLSVTPSAQKLSCGWHLPYDREDASMYGRIDDGTPDWSSWLCLQETSC